MTNRQQTPSGAMGFAQWEHCSEEELEPVSLCLDTLPRPLAHSVFFLRVLTPYSSTCNPCS